MMVKAILNGLKTIVDGIGNGRNNPANMAFNPSKTLDLSRQEASDPLSWLLHGQECQMQQIEIKFCAFCYKLLDKDEYITHRCKEMSSEVLSLLDRCKNEVDNGKR